MLQRSPREGVNQDELDALIHVRYEIGAGDIKVKMWDSTNCIGAHVAKELGKAPRSYVLERGGPLRELYFPPMLQVWSWRFASRRRLVRAIDRFLAGQKPWPWFAI